MDIFAKAQWSADSDKVRVTMPIVKVDEERRIVSGFATLDNIDKQGDIVTKEASVRAFETFKGNIREMHQPIAVGRVVAFRDDSYFDPTTNKIYSGVAVDAYISKGAQATWEKVLDGTLSGFSIGGAIHDTEIVYDENLDKSVRVVNEYELFELSLVDNPANEFATILSVQKLDDGSVSVDTMLKGEIENVFWCNGDGLVRLANDEASSCPVCEKKMTNIGFVESNDADKEKTVKSIFGTFRKEQTAVDEPIAENIAKEDTTVAEEVIETVEKSDEPAVAEVVETVEKSEEATTPAAETSDADLAKAVDDVKASVAEAVGELRDVLKSITDEREEVLKSVTSLKEELAALKDEVQDFSKRVDAVESDTAMRKSGDLGGVVQEETQIRKSAWGGRFLKSADLYR
jgi:uncharacterized protein YaaR (DUF327 family)